MTLTFREPCKFALLVPTSMGVRITPLDRQPVYSSNHYTMQATSAETNVASIISYLGLPVKVLTNFVQDSPIARFIKDNLASRHMVVEGPEVPQGGPWGYRHQINIADGGFGIRGPRVYNDRAGEVGQTLKAEDYDLERIFDEEGVSILHFSGLIAALSEKTGAFCLDLARSAKKYGTRISFDLNHRDSFWKNREKKLTRLFSELASMADMLIGNEEDFQLCLGLQGPEAGGKNLEEKTDRFKEMILRVRKIHTDATLYCTTLREVVSANHHKWGAISLAGDQWYVIPPRDIEILDRIGGGDGFVGGMLYGLLKGWPQEKYTRFGWATGALATSFLTDYAQPQDEEMVWNVWEGNARVQR